MIFNKKIFGHTGRFQGWVGGLNRRRHFDVLPDKMGRDVAPKLNTGTNTLYTTLYTHRSSCFLLILKISELCFPKY